MPRQKIKRSLALIFEGIRNLQSAFPGRLFTIDGRLVGDIGEVIAAIEYDLVLHTNQQPNHDADTSDGRKVQIKATFKDHLTFKTIPDYYLGFKLYEDGGLKKCSMVRVRSSLTGMYIEKTLAKNYSLSLSQG